MGATMDSARWVGIRLVYLATFVVCGYFARDIRLKAIREYGAVIHEFDPWFNYRATEYLHEHGLWEFFHWYDYKVWYPLGRPVGSTIYPGMQMTSVGIWNLLNNVIGFEMSLNDVCCYVPAWGGVSATFFLGLLTLECTGSWASGASSMAIMAIIPAHISRSVGGGYDNESVAMTALCMTFYFWVRSLRADPKLKDGEASKDSVTFGVITGLAYIYMVAAWGGFIFVLNLMSIHAAVLAVFYILRGNYSSSLHRAFTLFYVIGTAGAIQIPVVGWNPLKNLDQIAGFLVFFFLQPLEYCEVQRRKNKLNWKQLFILRVKAFLISAAILGTVIAILFPTGYFGPLGARIRGLFVKHTRTGNPLVDSVAEHQPASEQAYHQYMLDIYYVAPVGYVLSFFRWTDSNSFLIVYATVGYYLCNKMARLILLLGPVASALGGAAFGMAADQLIIYALINLAGGMFGSEVAEEKKEEKEEEKEEKQEEKEEKQEEKEEKKAEGKSKNGKKGKKADSKADAKPIKAKADESEPESESAAAKAMAGLKAISDFVLGIYNTKAVSVVRIAVAAYLIQQLIPHAESFYERSHQLAESMSNPQLMYKAKLRDGTEIILDDYREAYWWLRDNTPEDARVMAWWDYGYQITGIGNRTTIADGNTWNHEHIATLGRVMSAPEKRAHRIARHLADYMLVWAGGGGDDLAKSPHMARIGNSVFHDICSEPTCSEFGFYQGGVPTPMMKESILYKLTQYGYKQDVTIDPNRFTHVFTSKYGKCRIFKINKVSQESKDWVANPENRVCDRPGGWLCRGQYPPALHKLIAKRKNFAQLEDFNTKSDAQDDEYQKEYHARMAGKHPLQKNTPADPEKDEAEDTDESMEQAAPLKMIGCYANEKRLGADKVYGGGAGGASITLARNFAWENNKKYVAIARVGEDGHSFAFNSMDTSHPTMSDEGCRKPCSDVEGYFCGCAGGACDDLAAADGEENVRRWVVYEVPEQPKPDPKKKSKKKKKKKKKASKKDEEDL
jgi:dolichyl-diphosphooligosaccharide--protein glycosyltransferase